MLAFWKSRESEKVWSTVKYRHSRTFGSIFFRLLLQYSILFKVAFSKCQFTFVTITKSTRDVLDYLKKVSNHAKTVGQPIREFLTDGGGEFDHF